MPGSSSSSGSGSRGREIVVVGGGCFGLSTAVSLARKYPNDRILLLDRDADPPARDAASHDYNKIVRQDYSDETWARLASRAIRQWSTPEWSPYFGRSGCLVMSAETHPQAEYVRKALALQSDPSMAADGRLAVACPTPAAKRRCFAGKDASPPPELGSFEGDVAYLNPQSGWGNARGAMDMVQRKARALGVEIRGDEVLGFVYGRKGKGKGGEDVVGVRTRGEGVVKADLVVLAAGSWSSTLVPELGRDLLPTGHCVAHIQLTAAEARRYKDVPVVFHMDTGFYIFPPNENHIVKFAVHGPGYVNPATHDGHDLPSVPVSAQNNLPREGMRQLRAGLKRVYPGLVDKEWSETRMCWYCDSPSSDWLLDYHPKYPSLFLATGDSGHAFKFLPIIGDIIVSAMDRTLPPPLDKLFVFDKLSDNRGDPSRGGVATFARKVLGHPEETIERVEHEFRVSAKL